MHRIEIAVEKAYGDGMDTAGDQSRDQPPHRLFVKGADNGAARVEPLGDRQHPMPRHYWQRPPVKDVVNVCLVASLDLEDVLEPLGDQKRGRNALAFEDRVCSHRRAVHDVPEGGPIERKPIDPVEHAAL